MKFENIKTTIFNSKEDYLAFRQNWKQAVSKGFEPTVEHMMIYNGLRGVPLSKTFTPAVKLGKIVGKSNREYGAAYEAYETLKWWFARGNRWSEISRKKILEIFGDTVSEEMVKVLIEHLKDEPEVQ